MLSPKKPFHPEHFSNLKLEAKNIFLNNVAMKNIFDNHGFDSYKRINYMKEFKFAYDDIHSKKNRNRDTYDRDDKRTESQSVASIF